MFINAINYFRGIAILIIVAGHAAAVSGWDIDTAPEKLIVSLLLGGSALFVFISGYLFHHIFFTKFNYARFMKKRVVKILIPYIVLSTIAFAYFASSGNLPNLDQISNLPPDGWQDTIKIYFLYLFTGHISFAYWYIPFAMLLFTASPIFYEYGRLSARTQFALIVATSIVAGIVQRPLDNINIFQALVYFIPFYLFGMFCSIHKGLVQKYFGGREVFILIGLLAVIYLEVKTSGTYESLHKTIFGLHGFDFRVLQKLLLSLFFLVLLSRFETQRIKILAYFADISFPLYFVHPWVMNVFIALDVREYKVPGFLLFLAVLTFALVISVALIQLVKFTLRKKSCYFIGG